VSEMMRRPYSWDLAASDSGSGTRVERAKQIAGCLLLAFATLVLPPGCSKEPQEPPRVGDPATLRSIGQGQLIGFSTAEGAHAWQGIPYAEPPIGDLRWRSPQPPEPWTGTLDALAYGPSCVQFAPPGGARDGAAAGEASGDEDCLHLNIYAPSFAPNALPTGASRLPVMYWIHGGGNTIGDATVYDGALLALRNNVILVSVHYRLGTFGWFSHPALGSGGASPDDASGNYGTLDLVRGLAWIQQNISAFGGDPDRVTVFGESAGGSDTFTMLLSPRAEGLFHRAIVQSGSAHTTPKAEAENFVDDKEPGEAFSSGEVLLKLLIRDGRAQDRDGAKAALAAMADSEVADYLRGKSAADMLSIYEGDRLGGMYTMPKLIADGVVLPAKKAIDAFADGDYNQVPTILGTNRDESRLFMLFSSEYITRLAMLPLWVNDDDLFQASADFPTRMWKVRGVDAPAEAMRSVQGDSVFAYRFDWDEEPKVFTLDLSSALGAAHGLEIPFVFGWLSMGPVTNLVFPEDREEVNTRLSSSMMSYWAQFAHSGDPGRGRDGNEVLWTAWSSSGERGNKFIIFDTEADGGVRMSSDEPLTREIVLAAIAADPRLAGEQRARCAIYHGFLEWGREIDQAQYQEIEGGACGAAYPVDEFPWDG